MDTYEEIVELYEMPDEGGGTDGDVYAARLERIEALFASVADEKVRERLAVEVMQKALNVMLHDRTMENAPSVQQQDEYIASLKAVCHAVVNGLMESADDDLRDEVTEDLLRRVCFVVYGCMGGNDFDFDEWQVYLIAQFNDQGQLCCGRYNVARIEDSLNMDKGEFLDEYQRFLRDTGCSLDNSGNPKFDLWPARVESAFQMEWAAIFKNKADAVTFIDTVAGGLDKNARRKMRRIFDHTRTENIPPVDTDQLRKDAEGMEESVLRRIALMERWLADLSNNYECQSAAMNYMDEVDSLTSQLQETKNKLIDALANKEEMENLTGDYALELQEAYDRVREERDRRKAVEAEKTNVETQLKQTESTLESVREQMKILDSGGAKMKKLQELLETARTEKEIVMAQQDIAINKAVLAAHEEWERELFDRIKVRYKRTPDAQQKRFWLDSAKDAFKKMPTVEQLLDDFEDELDKQAEAKEAREETRVGVSGNQQVIVAPNLTSVTNENK